MPEKMERALEKEALARFGTTKSKKARALIFGTMRKTGWKPKREKK